MPLISKRVQYMLGHLTRYKHICLLSKPNWRRLQKYDDCNAFVVSRAALKARATDRTKIMATPVVRPPKRKIKEPTLEESKTSKVRAKRSRMLPRKLSPFANQWVTSMAVPKRLNLETMRRRYPMNETIHKFLEIAKSLPSIERSHTMCFPASRRRRRRKPRRALSSPADWDEHNKWLEQRARPRPTIEPRPLMQRKHKFAAPSPEELSSHMKILAAHKIRRDDRRMHPYDVRRGALVYATSDRVKKLAEPNVHEGPSPLMPGFVAPGAKSYKATERILKLSAPRPKNAGNEDLKENAFSISPIALKARCSPRLKRLAKPRVLKKI